MRLMKKEVYSAIKSLVQHSLGIDDIIGMHDYNLSVIVDLDVGITRGCYTNTLQWCDLKNQAVKKDSSVNSGSVIQQHHNRY